MEGRKLVGEMNKKFGASQEKDGAFRLEYSDVFIMMSRGQGKDG